MRCVPLDFNTCMIDSTLSCIRIPAKTWCFLTCDIPLIAFIKAAGPGGLLTGNAGIVISQSMKTFLKKAAPASGMLFSPTSEFRNELVLHYMDARITQHEQRGTKEREKERQI